MQGSFAEAGCSSMVRTPTIPAANAKNSAAVRMTFFNMASPPIQVDHAVFCAVLARRCDGYHFYKTCCDFSHTWVTVTRRPRGSSKKPLFDHPPSCDTGTNHRN